MITDRDKLMERTRAAVCYSNTHNDSGTDLAAFMAIFHPEKSEAVVRPLVNEIRDKERRRR